MSLCEGIGRTLNVALAFISGTRNGWASSSGQQSGGPKKAAAGPPRGSQLKPPAFGQRAPFSLASSGTDSDDGGGGVPLPLIEPQSSPAFTEAVRALSDGFEVFNTAQNTATTTAEWGAEPVGGGGGTGAAVPARQVSQVADYLVESVLLQLVEQRNLEVPILRRVLDLLVSVCRVVGDGRYVARLQHTIAARMSDSMGEISRSQSPRSRLEGSGPAGISAENSFNSVTSEGSWTEERSGDQPAPLERSIGQERGKERRIAVGVPSPVSVEGFEDAAGGLPGGLADSDDEDAGESGSVSVAGPEKTELAVERASDWDDWDDWDEEAEDIDDLVLEFGRCITSIRAEFGPLISTGNGKHTQPQSPPQLDRPGMLGDRLRVWLQQSERPEQVCRWLSEGS